MTQTGHGCAPAWFSLSVMVCGRRGRLSKWPSGTSRGFFKSWEGVATFSLLNSALELHSAFINAVLLDHFAVMEHVELLSGVLASKHHDGLLPARVLTLQGINMNLATQPVSSSVINRPPASYLPFASDPWLIPQHKCSSNSLYLPS